MQLRVLIPLLLVATLFSLPPPPAFAGGLNPSSLTLEVIQKTMKPRKVAMVIGIDRYDDPAFAPLSYARSDAEALAKVLQDKQYGGFDEVHLYVSAEQNTRQQLVAALQTQLSKLGMFDTFVLYFSGHGSLTLTDPAPAQTRGSAPGSAPPSSGPRHSFSLVLRDSHLDRLTETGISLEELRVMLSKARASRKAVILDSCFSGDGKSQLTERSRQWLQQSMQTLDQEKLEPTASAWLLAAQLGSNAYEDPRLKHGLYTHFLLEALTEAQGKADQNGDHAISAWEAHDYARFEVSEQVTSLQTPSGLTLTQQPEAFLHVVGVQDIFLSGERDESLKSATSLIYAYGTEKGGRGWKVEVDGEEKGAFPRAVSVKPGKHRVKVFDEDERLQASGALTFGTGQIYSVGLLMEELQGYRRIFGLRTVGTQQLSGNGADVWGTSTGGLKLQSGYRIRGGWLRGLTFLGEVGWQGGQDGASLPDVALRQVVSLEAEVMVRRSLGKLELGLGGFAGVQAAIPPSFGSDTYACPENDTGPGCLWASFPIGPAVWAGWRLDKHLQLSVETRVPFFPSLEFTKGTSGANVQLQVLAGLELDL